MQTIKLRIEDSRDARPIPAEAQLYLPQVRQALDLVGAALKREGEAKGIRAAERSRLEERDPCGDGSDGHLDLPWSTGRTHQNVAILGRRGAGKTSVLLSLLKILSDGEERREYANAVATSLGLGTEAAARLSNEWTEIARSCDVLPILEPSNLEPGEHVVATLVGAMLHRARKLLRRSPPQNESQGARADAFMRDVADVARHLPTLLAGQRLESVVEKLGVEGLQEELVENRSASGLERALASLTRTYLELVGKKLLVVALDDVDLDPDRGPQVLESLRRYLTSPCLLTLVTGDSALFSAVLRGVHGGRGVLGEPRATALDDHGRAEARRQVEDLVEQHLKKVLPPHLRVPLPDLTGLHLARVELGRGDGDKGNPGVTGSHAPYKRAAESAEEHVANLLRRCLDPVGHGRSDREARRLVRDFRFLVPPDARRFVELCALETPDCGVPSLDTDGLFFRFASVWQGALARFGLDARRLVELATADRIGLLVLNKLVEHQQLDEVALKLDPRTAEPTLNIVLAFLRFTMEANLARRQVPGLLTLGLDFFVLAHHIGAERSAERRRELLRDLDLSLLDSPRRIVRRLVRWAGRRDPVRAGIIGLCERDGRFEKLLDVHDTSAAAGWRRVLGDPEQIRIRVRATDSFVDACLEYLTRTRGTRLRTLPPVPCETSWTEISGYRWATVYLPVLLRTQRVRGALEDSRAVRVFGQRARPLACEMAPSPQLFRHLAGALPILVLQCWAVPDGRRTYLSPWHGLALVQRVVQRTVSLWDGGVTPAPSDVHGVVVECLHEHLGEVGGAAPPVEPPAPSPRPGGMAQRHLRSPDWQALAAQVDAAEEPWGLYPDFRRRRGEIGFSWPVPPPAGPLPEGESGGKDAAGKWRPCGAWFGTTGSNEPFLREEAIQDAGDLQACRRLALEGALDRMALAITEWVLVWVPELFRSVAGSSPGAERTSSPGFEEIRNIFENFLDDIASDAAFAGVWSGAGDILQRWVMSILNAVLIETVEGRPGGRRPPFIRSDPQVAPGRTGDREREGANHPLYQNLEILQRQPGPEEEHWRLGLPFLALASFPTIALFLPGGGPLPEAPATGENGSLTLNDLEGIDARDGLEWIIRLGGLFLIPLPSIEDERKKRWEQTPKGVLFDLAGLSWCGFDLRPPPPSPDVTPDPRVTLESRREGLISMLNSLLADIQPVADAREHEVDLSFLVYQTLRKVADRWP